MKACKRCDQPIGSFTSWKWHCKNCGWEGWTAPNYVPHPTVQCARCRTINRANADVCVKCDARINGISPSVSPSVAYSESIGRTGTTNKAVALVGAGVFLIFIAYFAWQYQVCIQYTQLINYVYCSVVGYPFRYMGLFSGIMGFVFIMGGLVVLGKGN